MKPSSERETILQVGDRVKLIADTLAWRAEPYLREKIAEVIEVRADGRISLRFRRWQASHGPKYRRIRGDRDRAEGDKQMSALQTPVTVERLERALLLAAHIATLDGDVYLPIFNRLEAELQSARRQRDTMSRAAQIISQRLHLLPTHRRLKEK